MSERSTHQRPGAHRDDETPRQPAEPGGAEDSAASGAGPRPDRDPGAVEEAAGGDADDAVEDQTAVLRHQIEEARGEAAAHLDDLKRLKAEFENFRKRTVRQQTAIMERASHLLVEKLLPILDNFELALLSAEGTRDYARLVRGVEMVFGELREVLGREGLRAINPHGEPFDPERHEAVLETGGGSDGDPFVVEVLRPGYELKDQLIRPAMVKVGRRTRGGGAEENAPREAEPRNGTV